MAAETATLRRQLTPQDLERTPPPAEGGGYELDAGELVYVCPIALDKAKLSTSSTPCCGRLLGNGSWGL
jgi:hypothetical protein